MNKRNIKIEELKAIARENGKKVSRGEMSFSTAVLINSSNVYGIEVEHPDLFPSPDKLINFLDGVTEKATT